ncbi:hypothetical protein RCL1_005419 [Eukaryota sp. TZLM3-RCL]
MEGTFTDVQRQLEYYFSHANLANDSFLRGLFRDGWVSLEEISNFNKIKQLCPEQTLNILTRAAQQSVYLDVDTSSTTPRVRPKQVSCIILRDIDPSTQESDLRTFLSPCNADLVEIKPDVLNSWLVTVRSEDDTKKVFDFLQLPTSLFNGKLVSCKIKTIPVYTPTPSVFSHPQYSAPRPFHQQYRGYSRGGGFRGGYRGRGGRLPRPNGSPREFPPLRHEQVNPRENIGTENHIVVTTHEKMETVVSGPKNWAESVKQAAQQPVNRH